MHHTRQQCRRRPSRQSQSRRWLFQNDRQRSFRSPLRRRKVLMNKLHCGGAFTHSGSHSLYGAMPHIASDEYSRLARLKPEWITFQCPAPRPMALATASLQIGAGKNESMIVSLYYLGEPFRVWQRTDEYEECVGWNSFFFALRGVVDRDRLESFVSMGLDDRGS